MVRRVQILGIRKMEEQVRAAFYRDEPELLFRVIKFDDAAQPVRNLLFTLFLRR
ncbi:hypothetical protein D3C76_1756530 [compost metagenome]